MQPSRQASATGGACSAPARLTVSRGLATPKPAASHCSVAVTAPSVRVTEPASFAAAGAAPASAATPAQASAIALGRGRRTGRLLLGRLLGLGLRRLEPLAGPRLVELDAPLAVIGLHERQARTERAPAAALEPGDGPGGAPGRDELLGHGRREVLAGLALPDHEPAPRVLARPAREALAVLDDVVAADRARAEVGPRDADVLELGVQLADGRPGELGDVLHELAPRLLATLDLAQALLPVARERGRRERVLAEQADDVHALPGRDQRAAVALDVADVDEPLDDRRAGRRRPDAGLLHHLAQLVVVDELAGGLHGAQQRRVAVAPRRLGLLGQHVDLARVDALALLQPRKLLVAPLVLLVAARGLVEALAVDAAPARHHEHPAARAEGVLGHRRLDARVLEDRLGVEDREEPPRHHVVHATVVVAHLLDLVVGVGRDDRVVVAHLGVVDHAPERQEVQPGDVVRGLRVLRAAPDAAGDRLELGHHVARQVARACPWIRERLVL